VRGYLTGSGYQEYLSNGTVCGISIPAGLHDGDQLPEAIFTPAFKAELGEHDENISFERSIEIVGEQPHAKTHGGRRPGSVRSRGLATKASEFQGRQAQTRLALVTLQSADGQLLVQPVSSRTSPAKPTRSFSVAE